MSLESETFIPAWKRIGLKLKRSAEDLSEAPVAKQPRLELASKEHVHAAVLDKTRPKSSITDRLAIKNGAGDILPFVSIVNEDKKSNLHPSTEARDNLPIRRASKTVRFEAGTKSEDGEDLVDVSNDPNFFNQGVVIDDEQTHAKSTKKRAESNEQRRREAAAALEKATNGNFEGKNQLRSHLIYLESYVKGPNDWKFNKQHQTYLLKHLYDFDRIPTVYDNALYSYFADLQGNDARKRLKQEALTIAAPVTSMNHSALGAAVNGLDSGSKSSKSTADSNQIRHRALGILEALGVEEETNSSDANLDSAEAPLAVKEKPVKKTKKKKIRGRKRRKGKSS